VTTWRREVRGITRIRGRQRHRRRHRQEKPDGAPGVARFFRQGRSDVSAIVTRIFDDEKRSNFLDLKGLDVIEDPFES